MKKIKVLENNGLLLVLFLSELRKNIQIKKYILYFDVRKIFK